MELVVTELGAAMGMAVRIDSVDVVRLIDLGRRFNGPGNIIDAAYGRDDPNFIADAGLAVCPFISEELVFFFTFLRRALRLFRFVGVIQEVAQFTLDVVGMDPGSLRNIHFSGPDGETVFYDIFAFFNLFNGDFMACRDVLADGERRSADGNAAALGNSVDSDGNIIISVYLEYVHHNLLMQSIRQDEL